MARPGQGTRCRGTQRGKIPPILFANYRGSALLDSDIYAQMFERHACADIQLERKNSSLTYTSGYVNLEGVGFMPQSVL